MNIKTILIIIISVLVTVVLMNNTEEVDFWLFGDARIPKLAILGSMFGLGLIVGFMLGRPRKEIASEHYDQSDREDQITSETRTTKALSDEDREYIKD